MQKPEASLETIKSTLRPISNEKSFLVLERRRLESIESSLLTDNRFQLLSKIPEDYGDGVVTNGYRNTFTASKLRGSEHALRAGTHVRYEAYKLPVDVSEKGIRDFMYREEVVVRRLGSISLNECTWLFGSIKTELSHFFETPSTDLDVAAEGVAWYLNTPAENTEESDLIASDIAHVRHVIQDLKYQDRDKVFQQLSRSFRPRSSEQN